MEYIFLCIPVVVFPNIVFCAWDLNESSGCFGSGSSDEDFLTPECPKDDIILVQGVYHGSKNKTWNCPSESTDLNRIYSRCCTHSQHDCLIQAGTGSNSFHSNCTGRNRCYLRVDRIQTGFSCAFLQFMSETNYMLIRYYCIPGETHKSISIDSNFTGSSVILHNDNYPEALSSLNATCRVSSPCGSKVKLSVLDLRFGVGVNGSCGHRLVFIDVEFDIEFVLNCLDNNDFERYVVFVSNGSLVFVTFENFLTSGSGQFLIQFESVNASEDLIVACGNSINEETLYTCTTTSKAPPLFGKLTSPRVPHTILPISTRSLLTQLKLTQERTMHPGTIAAIVVVSLCFVAIVAMFVVCYLKKKNQQSQNANRPIVSGRSKDKNPGFFSFSRSQTGSTWVSASSKGLPPPYDDDDYSNLMRKKLSPPSLPGSSQSSRNKITPGVKQFAPMATVGSKLPPKSSSDA